MNELETHDSGSLRCRGVPVWACWPPALGGCRADVGPPRPHRSARLHPSTPPACPPRRPAGQFGTRLQGGKDAASPRYIFTRLAPLTRHLFNEHDDRLLAYLNEEGQSIEPDWCARLPAAGRGCAGTGRIAASAPAAPACTVPTCSPTHPPLHPPAAGTCPSCPPCWSTAQRASAPAGPPPSPTSTRATWWVLGWGLGWGLGWLGWGPAGVGGVSADGLRSPRSHYIPPFPSPRSCTPTLAPPAGVQPAPHAGRRAAGAHEALVPRLQGHH